MEPLERTYLSLPKTKSGTFRRSEGQRVALSMAELWSCGPAGASRRAADENVAKIVHVQLPFSTALSSSQSQSASRLRGAAFVMVVQTAEVRNGDDRALRRCGDGSRHGRILLQRQVRSRFQVILDVCVQDAPQSALIGDKDVIEA